MKTALTPLQIATNRAPAEPFARQRYLFALEQARLIETGGGNPDHLDQEWRIARQDDASTAGHLEGLASIRAEHSRP